MYSQHFIQRYVQCLYFTTSLQSVVLEARAECVMAQHWNKYKHIFDPTAQLYPLIRPPLVDVCVAYKVMLISVSVSFTHT